MIDLKIISPYGEIFREKVESITLNTRAGVITILPDHAPIVSIITTGEMLIRSKVEEYPYALSGGVLEVQSNSRVTILADSAEKATEIDIERAEEAKRRAEEKLSKMDQIDDIEFAKIQAMIEKETARIQVGRKWRRL